MKVLVVDDARVMRNILMNSIKQNYDKPVDFLEAGDGEETLHLLTKKKLTWFVLIGICPKSMVSVLLRKCVIWRPTKRRLFL